MDIPLSDTSSYTDKKNSKIYDDPSLFQKLRNNLSPSFPKIDEQLSLKYKFRAISPSKESEKGDEESKQSIKHGRK